MEASPHIRRILQRLPDSPGVYQHYDADGNLLYIGKAKSLKKRVASYFNKQTYENGKTRLLVKKIADIRFIVVETEVDALLLENNLIKEHQPRYNIELKDDKTYPSIVIRNERFPRVHPTRNVIQNGSEYFGPYASVKTMNAVLDIARKLHPIRNCSYDLSQKNIDAGKFRACLEHDLGNCKAPCVGKQSLEDYDAGVKAIRDILKGNIKDLTRTYDKAMKEAAADFAFEAAEEFKRRKQALQKFQAKSTVVNPSIHDVEVYSVVSDPSAGYVNFMKVMDGGIVHGQTLELRKRLEETDQELLEYGILEIRRRFDIHSPEIYTNLPVRSIVQGVKWHVPQRGDKKRLIELSERNAKYTMLDKRKQQEQVDPEAAQNRIMETLQKDLHLKELPVHIECFDNSNIHGTHPASACVVFKKAKPAKGDYRKFNIKTVQGPDDFASMAEVVYRRYKRLRDDGEPLPQLIIVDGGKGQLSSAVGALEELGLMGQVAIIGIAKRLEELYFPGDSIPLHLDKRSESLKLIQRMRDEAHRFSLTHHRKRRSSAALHSALDDIPGVGPTTRRNLMAAFGTVDAIKAADEAALLKVVSLKVAQAIRSWASETKE
jgi:excinuclease ABC subunit C